MPDLSHLKPGDYVALPRDNYWTKGPTVDYKVLEVTKVTKTQIVAGDLRFSKVTGCQIGGYSQAIEATLEIIKRRNEQVKTRNEWVRQRRLLEDLAGKVKEYKLTREQESAIAELWASLSTPAEAAAS